VEDTHRLLEQLRVAAQEQVQEPLAVVRAAPRALGEAIAAADHALLSVDGKIAPAWLELPEAEVAERAAVAEPERGEDVQRPADSCPEHQPIR
jgi:hypothetical protein